MRQNNTWQNNNKLNDTAECGNCITLSRMRMGRHRDMRQNNTRQNNSKYNDTVQNEAIILYSTECHLAE